MEVEQAEPVQINMYQSNTYRKDLSWLHFDDEARVQERQQVKNLQPYISVFVVYPTISSDFKFNSRERTEKSKSKAVPFVVNYHPSLKCLHMMIRDNNYLHYVNEEVKNLFLPGPTVLF